MNAFSSLQMGGRDMEWEIQFWFLPSISLDTPAPSRLLSAVATRLQSSHPVSPCKENVAPAHLSWPACPPTGFQAFPSISFTPALVLWLKKFSAEAEKEEVCPLCSTSPRDTSLCSLCTGILPKYQGQGSERWSMDCGGRLGCE